MMHNNNTNNAFTALANRSETAFEMMRVAPSKARDHALIASASAIADETQKILAANAIDIAAAHEKGVKNSFIDRLTLDESRITAMTEALHAIAALQDPVGRELASWTRPNGLKISRISRPLGVLGIIFESRPNVTVDAAGLAIKSANCVILRGGSDSINTSMALTDLMRKGLAEAGLPMDAVIMIDTPDREMVGAMLRAQGQLAAVIPRGGKTLVERVQTEARVPVFAHLEGICHVFVHREADVEKAVSIVVNAKMRRTGICGAAETLLIDTPLLKTLWPRIATFLNEAGCEIRGDKACREVCPWIIKASDDDFGREFLDSIIAVRAVDGVDEAVEHIRRYGSEHTESIITEDEEAAEYFLSHVSSAIVMVNTSTQFADGGEFGMGAEIGIATGRIHARGPVGAEQLTCFNYSVRGNGQIRP